MWSSRVQGNSNGPLVPMVRLVPIEKHPIPMVLLVNMHLQNAKLILGFKNLAEFFKTFLPQPFVYKQSVFYVQEAPKQPRSQGSLLPALGDSRKRWSRGSRTKLILRDEITGSPSSKYEHRRASALLRNIRKYKDLYWKKNLSLL